MRARFILSETWANLTRNLSMLLSLTLVTFISFLFIGASVLTQAQITKAKGDWYDKVEVVVWLCPDGTSQSANCASGKSPSANEITALQKTIRDELNDVVSNIDYVSKQDFYDNTFTKQYPNGEFQGRTLIADDMQDSLWLKLKDPTKYQVVSEVLSGRGCGRRYRSAPDLRPGVRRAQPSHGGYGCARRRDGGGRHPADRNHHSYVRRIQTNRNRNHEVRGCLELDDSSAVHSGGHHRLADRLGALVPDAFGYRQRVRHRLAGEIRYMDSLCESAHGTGDIAVPGCGRDTAVHHRFNHLVAALFEGVTRPAYPREM